MQDKTNTNTNNNNNNNNNIRLLSYNFYLRPMLISAKGHDYKNDRLKEFCKTRLNDFDIICFQEVFPELNRRRKYLVKKLKKAGYNYIIKSIKPGFPKLYAVDGGCIIASRYPIVSSGCHYYKRGVCADGTSSKGILYAKIQIGEKFIHVFNTHTQADYSLNDDETKLSRQTRRVQLLEYKEYLDKKCEGNDYPAFCCGDFNVNARAHNDGHSDGDEYIDFMKIFQMKNGEIVDCLKRDLNGYHPVTYGDTYFDEFGVEKPRDTVITYDESCMDKQRLDYILHYTPYETTTKTITEKTRVEEFRSIGNKFPFLSDHFGVVTEFHFVE